MEKLIQSITTSIKDAMNARDIAIENNNRESAVTAIIFMDSAGHGIRQLLQDYGVSHGEQFNRAFVQLREDLKPVYEAKN